MMNSKMFNHFQLLLHKHMDNKFKIRTSMLIATHSFHNQDSQSIKILKMICSHMVSIYQCQADQMEMDGLIFIHSKSVRQVHPLFHLLLKPIIHHQLWIRRLTKTFQCIETLCSMILIVNKMIQPPQD